jgi:hypothetical protein
MQNKKTQNKFDGASDEEEKKTMQEANEIKGV